VAKARPPLFAEKNIQARIDTRLLAAARLLKLVRSRGLVGSEQEKGLARRLARLAVERQRMIEGERTLQKQNARYDRTDQTYQSLAEELEPAPASLSPTRYARARTFLEKLRGALDGMRTEIGQRLRLRAETRATLVARSRLLVEDLRAVVSRG